MKLSRIAIAMASCFACSRGETTAPASDAAMTPATTPAASSPAAAAVEPDVEKPAEPAAAPDASDDGKPVEPADAKTPDAKAPEPAQGSGVAFDAVEGAKAADVIAKWGEPDTKRGAAWIYRFPREGCVDRQIVYTLQMKRGVVAKVDRTTEQTGEHCLEEF